MATIISRQEEVAEKRRYWKEHLDSWQVSPSSAVRELKINHINKLG
jgi:hypothetical protein